MAIIKPGQRYGRLTVVEKELPYAYPSGQTTPMWRCVCDCGNTTVVQAARMLKGATRSCGCLRQETSSVIHTTHGMTKTRLYKIWDMMRQRCNNPTDTAYRHYGGRGIKVCGEWDDFMLFYNWSMSHGYNKRLTLDRIDNDGNYSPLNCRWATALEQANNKRSNLPLTCNGITKTVAQWARATGISKDAIYKRVNAYGWGDEAAVTTPTRAWAHRPYGGK